jgi:isopenicillin N synthase-like dioxygenase
MTAQLSVIDVSPLFGTDAGARARTAEAIRSACRTHGFFYATGHGIAPGVLDRLDAAARAFFALPQAEKLEIAMVHGGRAWRGYFPVGGELTSGRPDNKEGLYFGSELGADDPRVQRRLPLHGANLFPAQPDSLRFAVDTYMSSATATARAILEGIALSLNLDAQYFHRQYTADPTVLFRIFHYPPADPSDDGWGVGEHTDYGLLTLLAQDDCGGLEVKTRDGWIDAPPIPETLVCNIGDMLDRLTGGVYKSTPHRARNESGRGRLSFPLFFDPGFDAEIQPLPGYQNPDDDWRSRWDRASVHEFRGAYGDYLLGKVSKVFPDLGESVIAGP